MNYEDIKPEAITDPKVAFMVTEANSARLKTARGEQPFTGQLPSYVKTVVWMAPSDCKKQAFAMATINAGLKALWEKCDVKLHIDMLKCIHYYCLKYDNSCPKDFDVFRHLYMPRRKEAFYIKRTEIVSQIAPYVGSEQQAAQSVMSRTTSGGVTQALVARGRNNTPRPSPSTAALETFDMMTLISFTCAAAALIMLVWWITPPVYVMR